MIIANRICTCVGDVDGADDVDDIDGADDVDWFRNKAMPSIVFAKILTGIKVSLTFCLVFDHKSLVNFDFEQVDKLNSQILDWIES